MCLLKPCQTAVGCIARLCCAWCVSRFAGSCLQSWQFEYQWFTLFYELCIFLWVTYLVIVPSANLAPLIAVPRKCACAAATHGCM